MLARATFSAGAGKAEELGERVCRFFSDAWGLSCLILSRRGLVWAFFGCSLWVWVVGRGDLADGVGMSDRFGQFVLGQVGNIGWDQLVTSMRGAIEDRSHVVNLGIGVGVILVVWINWRVARWVLGQLDASEPGAKPEARPGSK